MIHMHNSSTLLGNHRRAIYYPPTGTGRDSYIMTNNGGTNVTYRPQGVAQLGNYMKLGATTNSFKPASCTRMQKYISDGTGRDKYVVSHHGGQFQENQQCSLMLKRFQSTIRDHCPQKTVPWRKIHFRENIIAKNQKNMVQRLSEPKTKVIKYEDIVNQYKK